MSEILEQMGDVTFEAHLKNLFKASYEGNIILMSEIIKKIGIPIDSQDHNGNTAMHQSAKGDKWVAINALKLWGAQTTIFNKQGFSALHVAAALSKHEAMQALLAWDANPNDYVDGFETPLIIASKKADHKAVNFLLKAGADLHTFTADTNAVQGVLFSTAPEVDKAKTLSLMLGYGLSMKELSEAVELKHQVDTEMASYQPAQDVSDADAPTAPSLNDNIETIEMVAEAPTTSEATAAVEDAGDAPFVESITVTEELVQEPAPTPSPDDVS